MENRIEIDAHGIAEGLVRMLERDEREIGKQYFAAFCDGYLPGPLLISLAEVLKRVLPADFPKAKLFDAIVDQLDVVGRERGLIRDKSLVPEPSRN